MFLGYTPYPNFIANSPEPKYIASSFGYSIPRGVDLIVLLRRKFLAIHYIHLIEKVFFRPAAMRIRGNRNIFVEFHKISIVKIIEQQV